MFAVQNGKFGEQTLIYKISPSKVYSPYNFHVNPCMNRIIKCMDIVHMIG